MLSQLFIEWLLGKLSLADLLLVGIVLIVIVCVAIGFVLGGYRWINSSSGYFFMGYSHLTRKSV